MSGISVESAAKWTNARTLTINGDSSGSVSIDGSQNVTMSLVRRGASVGQSNNSTTNPWYKFASLSLSGAAYVDRNIVFHVYRTYADSTNCTLGILRVNVRATSAGTWASGYIVWELLGAGINPADFVLAHKNPSDTSLSIELWCKCAATYTGYHFDVISESDRISRNTNYWTLYNTWSEGSQAEIPSDYTQVTSVIGTIKNNLQTGIQIIGTDESRLSFTTLNSPYTSAIIIKDAGVTYGHNMLIRPGGNLILGGR